MVEPDEECLHCELVKAIEDYTEKRIAGGLEVNIPDVTDMIVEALGQFLLEAVPVEERATMIAHALEHLGAILKSEATAETRH